MSEELKKEVEETAEEVVEEVIDEEVAVEEEVIGEADEELDVALIEEQPKVCKKCGAQLEDGQEFCPKCGKKVASLDKEDVVAAVSKFGDTVKDAIDGEVKKGNKKKLIIGAVAIVLVLVLAIALLGGGKDFNDMYGDISSNYWCTIASDGTYMRIDTNPYNLDNSHNSTAYYKIKEINSDLGFPSSTFQEMGQTRAIDGRQTATAGKYTASWTYHPDKGLEVLYTIN